MTAADSAALPETLKLSPTPAAPASGASSASSTRGALGHARRPSRLLPAIAVLIALAGIFLRLYPSATMRKIGFDEVLYRVYVHVLDARGVMNYDEASKAYVLSQSRPKAKAELPPTRFLYVFSGYLWKTAFYGDAQPLDLRKPGAYENDPALCSLRRVSAVFSILFMLAAGAAAWRIGGAGLGVAVLALTACSPLQIHTTQHAMIDGFFAFWATLAVWSLWENLQARPHRHWLTLYAVSLFCMVLTKENAFFVYCGLAGLLGLNRWLRWGNITRPLLFTTLLAPAFAAAALCFLAGGPATLISVYRLLVTNAQHLDYAIETGDGPWYRYFIDLLVLNPLVLCLAIGAALRGWKDSKWIAYALGFIVVTYALMCNVRYGMNVRYTTIWELPLCLLAVTQLKALAAFAGRHGRYVLPALVALVCVHELVQYHTFFVREGLYELGPFDLLHAIRVLK